MSSSAVPGGVAATLAHRLLGAVECVLPDVEFADPVRDELSVLARSSATADGAVATMGFTDGHDAFSAPLQVARVQVPHGQATTTALARTLAVQPPVAEWLVIAATGSASTVAAEHGRRWFALAVVCAAAVVRATRPTRVWTGTDDPALTVGWALDAATTLLGEVPMPAGWPAARAAELRAGFLLPRMSSTTLHADRGRVGLLEAHSGSLPETGEASNALVSAVPGGVVLHVGVGATAVTVVVETTAFGPEHDTEPSIYGDDWDQIVEISYDNLGPCRLVGQPHTVWPDRHDLAFPWPTSARARVHASGRGSGGEEQYLIRLWEAPHAPEAVLRDNTAASSFPAVQGTPLIRTDFADDAAWTAALRRMSTPNASGFLADIGVIDDIAYDAATVSELLTFASTAWSRHRRCLFVVDAAALASSELQVLVVGLSGEDRGRTFRVVAEELWGVENNLAQANMDFDDFANATQDGVHRGF